MKKNLLFDLDGTLTDPKEGITRSIAFSLEKLGHPAPPLDQLVWCIGPPIHESFLIMLKDKALAEKGVEHYRDRYMKTGMYENFVYDGIQDLLMTLKKNDFTLRLATSKLGSIAESIIDHFKFRPYFAKVYGSEKDGTRGDKGELIAFLLKQENLDPKDCIMIGDRKHDIIGAKKNGVSSIGVTWGFGSREELQKAGADEIVMSPPGLAKRLL